MNTIKIVVFVEGLDRLTKRILTEWSDRAPKLILRKNERFNDYLFFIKRSKWKDVEKLLNQHVKSNWDFYQPITE